MKRLYFRIPTVESAVSIVSELQLIGVKDKHIFLIGKDHHRLHMAHLHEAGILQTSDLLHALRRGTLIGSVCGLIVGVVLLFFPPGGLTLGWGVVVGLGLIGAAFGAWGSTLVGISVPNPVVARCHDALEAGELLMLLDVDLSREQEIVSLIKRHHPEALIESYSLKK